MGWLGCDCRRGCWPTNNGTACWWKNRGRTGEPDYPNDWPEGWDDGTIFLVLGSIIQSNTNKVHNKSNFNLGLVLANLFLQKGVTPREKSREISN